MHQTNAREATGPLMDVTQARGARESVAVLDIEATFANEPAATPLRLSCVVPVYNEAPGIAHFLEHLHRCVSALTPCVELIVVNDGSTDGSAAEILRCADRLDVHYIELSRNFGKECAIQAGLDAAAGDCVVILDADFQHPVELIARMVQRWRAGFDMVYAVRSDRNDESWLKRLGSRAIYRLLEQRSAVRIPPNAGDFRLLDRKVVLTLRALPERARFMKGLYAWSGFKSEAIEFTPAQRRHGESKFGMLRLANLALTGITAFSTTPLRLVLLVGFLTATGAVLFGSWIVFEKLFMKQPIAGFTTLAASILFLAGVQLLALGIVGEYVGRIFEEVKKRPLYVLSRVVNYSAVPRPLIERDRS